MIVKVIEKRKSIFNEVMLMICFESKSKVKVKVIMKIDHTSVPWNVRNEKCFKVLEISSAQCSDPLRAIVQRNVPKSDLDSNHLSSLLLRATVHPLVTSHLHRSSMNDQFFMQVRWGG